MKQIFILVFLYVSTVVFSQEEINKNLPKIVFKEFIHNFGEIEYNSLAEYNFVFKNEGKGPLIIKNTKTT